LHEAEGLGYRVNPEFMDRVRKTLNNT
jgi:hypothetical protein